MAILKPKILLVFGTRPEAVKLAPLCSHLASRERFEVQVCVTAQHRQMLDQVLELFGITPDYDLDLMRPNQSLTTLTRDALSGVGEVLDVARPDCLIVQGDTTTTLAAAMSAFYRDIRVAHVEAGLRTGLRRSPFPEEFNRRATTLVSDWHFAPTEGARNNLLSEGIPEERVFVTGNTVVDALHQTRTLLETREEPTFLDHVGSSKRWGLVTCHRRESFDGGIEGICRAIESLAKRGDMEWFFPVHPNPRVRGPVYELLGDVENVHLLEPLSYVDFVSILSRCAVVLTDSGGIQEEAPSLSVPVIVLRETTERPEVIESGAGILVGTDCDRIVSVVNALLENESAYRAMSEAVNPFGDGHACLHIGEILAHLLCPSEVISASRSKEIVSV